MGRGWTLGNSTPKRIKCKMIDNKYLSTNNSSSKSKLINSLKFNKKIKEWQSPATPTPSLRQTCTKTPAPTPTYRTGWSSCATNKIKIGFWSSKRGDPWATENRKRVTFTSSSQTTDLGIEMSLKQSPLIPDPFREDHPITTISNMKETRKTASKTTTTTSKTNLTIPTRSPIVIKMESKEPNIGCRVSNKQ